MKSSHLFLKFAVMGAIGTVVHYIVMVSLVQLMAVDPGIAAMVGATFGAICNYFLNYRFTFKSDKRHLETLSRFILVAGLSIVLNGLVVKSLTLFGVNYFVSQIFSTLFILGVNFFLSKLWIFKKVQQ